jgi:hypothetical protein
LLADCWQLARAISFGSTVARHAIEVDYHAFRRELMDELAAAEELPQ